MSLETDLITAFHERLSGADGHSTALTHDGEAVPVYTGNAPTSGSSKASVPYVVIGRPRTRGDETIDGVRTPEVRVQLRVHTAFPPGKGNHFQAYQIADAAHDLLEAAPLPIAGKTPYLPEPDKQPVPSYDKGDEEALDLSVRYRFPSL